MNQMLILLVVVAMAIGVMADQEYARYDVRGRGYLTYDKEDYKENSFNNRNKGFHQNEYYVEHKFGHRNGHPYHRYNGHPHLGHY